MEQRYQVGARSSFLATREHARQAREDIEDQLGTVPPGTPVILDFTGVHGVTVSFVDELLAKLIVGGGPAEQAGHGIVVEGASDGVREVLETALARRKVTVPVVRPPARGSGASRPMLCRVIHAALSSRA